MSNFKKAVMTNTGADLLAESVVDGFVLEFVKMVVGSGIYTEEECRTDALRERIALKEQKQDFGFSSITTEEQSVCLKAFLTNDTLIAGYRMTEIGIIARKKGDESEGILYSIAVADEPDYMPDKTNPIEIIQEYYTKISNADNVVINVEMSSYALAEDLINEAARAEAAEKKLQDGKLSLTGGTMRGDIDMNGFRIFYGEKEIDFSDKALEIGVREAGDKKIWSSYVNFDGSFIHAQVKGTIKLVSFGSTLQLSEDIGLHNGKNTGIYTHGSSLGLNAPADIDTKAGGHINFDANEEINIRSATEDINLESGDDIRINAEKDLELCSVGNKIWMYTAEDIRLLPGAASRSDAPSPEKYVKAGNIQGVKTSDGEKPSISNFKEVRAEELYEDGEKLSDRYLSLSGGKLTGDVSIPIERSSKDGSIPVAGSTMENLETLTDLRNYKTYLGAVQYKNVWNNIISIRHRNGTADGVNYGMYVRSQLNGPEGLIYNKQTGEDTWQGERTLLDSVNYNKYALPISGGDVDGEVTLKQGFNAHNIKLYNQVNGYVKFAQLTICGTYVNMPVVFEIIKRGSTQPTILSVMFSGVSNLDPPLAGIKYYGSKLHIYIIKSDAGKWDLYIECGAYESICVTDVKIAYRYRTANIVWTSTFVETLPNGAYEAAYILEASSAETAKNADTVDGMHADEFLPKNGGTMDDGAEVTFVDDENNRVKISGSEIDFTNTNTNSVNERLVMNTFGISVEGEGYHIITRYDTGNSLYGLTVLSRNGYGTILPFNSDAMDIGTMGIKWRNIYATNGTIQTSDRTMKTDIEELNYEKIKDFILGLITRSYKMIDGTSGRTHWGLIAQDVEALMEKLGMDSKDFAGLIKSPKTIESEVEEEVEAEEETKDENGEKIIQKVIKKIKRKVYQTVKNEYIYGLRYEEFIAPLIKFVQYLWKKIAKQGEEMDEQKKEMEGLKARMEKLEEAVKNIQNF